MGEENFLIFGIGWEWGKRGKYWGKPRNRWYNEDAKRRWRWNYSGNFLIKFRTPCTFFFNTLIFQHMAAIYSFSQNEIHVLVLFDFSQNVCTANFVINLKVDSQL